MTESVVTRGGAKVLVFPVYHEASGSIIRQTWRASLAERSSAEPFQRCKHTHGHKTTDAAVRCGTEMWNRLPAAELSMSETAATVPSDG